ncbi:hypothetical protein C8R47DRAFT_1063106 [Mycena vitilis]|nr:hypothetical protein C8R47DRAFT_1063106 [Mycena vitilis]
MFLKILQSLFGFVVYLIRVREFQKRGPPHDHVALKIRKPPRAVEDIDKVLSAELPRAPGVLRDNVLKFMTHQHNRTSTYHRCGWSTGGGKCQYGFPKPLTPVSYFDERGLY